MPGKTAFLTIIILLLKTSLFAQFSLGVEGGLSYNSYHTNISNRVSTRLDGHVGYTVAVPLRYQVSSWLSIIAAPGLVQKGYSMRRTDSLSGEYDEHINTYLQLPIGVGAACRRGRWHVGMDLGLYMGYWLGGRVKGRTADVFGSTGGNSEQYPLVAYDQAYSFNSQRDLRWEEGWWIGPSVQYHVTPSWSLIADGKFYQSLTRQEKASVSPIPAYNRTWLFSIGGLWSLPTGDAGPPSKSKARL
jgi:hypothetical protein